MAQRKFWNYRDDDLTKDINRWLSGLIDSGLYRGFDPVLDGTMTLKLNHDVTGAIRVDANEDWVEKFGVLCTKQGMIIQDDTVVELPIATTSGASRNDIIVFNHKYTEIEGGEAGFYSVIKGESTGFPLLPFETTQTIIGYLTLPANCVGLNTNGVIYRRAPQPAFANHLAFIEKNNGFFLTNLDARLNKLINLANPTSNQDAATKYYVDQSLISNIIHATETSRGIVELATVEETLLGEDDQRVLTPFKAKKLLEDRTASQDDVNTGSGSNSFVTPKTLRNSFATVDRLGVISLATPQEAKDGFDNSKAVTPFALQAAFPMKPHIFEITNFNIDGGFLTHIMGHNLTVEDVDEIVAVSGVIINDAGTEHHTMSEGSIEVDDLNITITIPTGSKFDKPAYSGNGTRGWVTIWVKSDLDSAPNVLSVNAGPDYTRSTKPDLGITLISSITTVGSPLDTIVWSVVSMPEGGVSTANNYETKYFGLRVNGALGEYVVRVTVTNMDGEVATDDMVLTVIEGQNTAPNIRSITKPSVIDKAYEIGEELTYGQVNYNTNFATSLSISSPVWSDTGSTEFSDNVNNEIRVRPIIGGNSYIPAVDKLVNFKGSIQATIGRFSDPAVVPQFDIILRITGTNEDVVVGSFTAASGFNLIEYNFFYNVLVNYKYDVVFKLKNFVGSESITFNVTGGYSKWTTGKVLGFNVLINTVDSENDPITYTFNQVTYSESGGFGEIVTDSVINYKQSDTNPNSWFISGILPPVTESVWYGFEVTADDGRGGTDSEYFAVLASSSLTDGIDDKEFQIKMTADSSPTSNRYVGFVNMNPSSRVSNLKAFVVNPDSRQLDTLLELSSGGISKIYSVGTHNVNQFIGSSVGVDFSLLNDIRESQSASASVTFKAYDSRGNVMGEVTRLVYTEGSSESNYNFN